MVDELQKLLTEIEAHYQARGFIGQFADAPSELAKTVQRSYRSGMLILPGAVLKCDVKKLSSPLGSRSPRPADAGDLRQAAAIFAFSFGYRLKSGQHIGPQARLPGKNNRALADITAALKSELPSVPVFAQFEIADALEDRDPPVPVECRTPAEDWGTKTVLDYFLRSHGWRALPGDSSVLVVAHAHHLTRCCMLVEEVGLRCLLPQRSYNEYDPAEKQPRVKDHIEFIHSDFISLVATWGR